MYRRRVRLPKASLSRKFRYSLRRVMLVLTSFAIISFCVGQASRLNPAIQNQVYLIARLSPLTFQETGNLQVNTWTM